MSAHGAVPAPQQFYKAHDAAIDVRAVRKAAQRVHDLEQLRAVLARELCMGG
ncbi:MAG TPA: hypothetical protein VED45_05675 [Steroidobacteraceae bacterium]|nr:hypothetical protein [Steroidobacteraceae bacterium]